jgi:hypothetical protein
MTVEELKVRIQELDAAALSDLRFWMNTLEDDAWDWQIRNDAGAGRLDELVNKAMEETEAVGGFPLPGCETAENPSPTEEELAAADVLTNRTRRKAS